MDLAAFYFQAAEAAATVAVDVEAPTLASRTAVLLKFDVQQAVALGAGDAAAAHGKATLSLGAAAAVGVMDHHARTAFQGGAGRDHICPECGKAFLSGKAMYGHLRAHPERGYKGASRPSTPVASSASVPAAGDARTKKAPELPAIKWPVTARRSRTAVIAASPPVSSVLLLEPARSTESAPSLLEPPRRVEPVPLQLDPPRCSVEPAVLLLEQARGTGKEEEEAAMTLLKLYHRMRGEAPQEPEHQLPMQVQQMHADNAAVAQQIPPPSQLDLPADHVAPAATHHAPVEHIFGIIVEPQAPDVEQSNVTAAAASKGKMPMEPEEHVSSGALVLFRDKNDKLASPGPSKRPRKRPLQDPDQTQPADGADAVEEDRMPPLRRIPSPASDRRFVCPIAMCAKTFPTHQALGGHMASHNRAVRCAAAQHIDGLAAAHAVQNIMIHHQLRQDAALGEDVVPPVPRAPKTHSCSRCDLIFPTGQALGGHMRKHWLEEKARAAPATALEVPTVTPAAVPSAPINALALPVPAAVPAAPANAMVLAVPIVAEAVEVEPAVPNGRPWAFDLNEMPME